MRRHFDNWTQNLRLLHIYATSCNYLFSRDNHHSGWREHSASACRRQCEGGPTLRQQLYAHRGQEEVPLHAHNAQGTMSFIVQC